MNRLRLKEPDQETLTYQIGTMTEAGRRYTLSLFYQSDDRVEFTQIGDTNTVIVIFDTNLRVKRSDGTPLGWITLQSNKWVFNSAEDDETEIQEPARYAPLIEGSDARCRFNDPRYEERSCSLYRLEFAVGLHYAKRLHSQESALS